VGLRRSSRVLPGLRQSFSPNRTNHVIDAEAGSAKRTATGNEPGAHQNLPDSFVGARLMGMHFIARIVRDVPARDHALAKLDVLFSQ